VTQTLDDPLAKPRRQRRASVVTTLPALLINC
jgi:hypothetical protein